VQVLLVVFLSVVQSLLGLIPSAAAAADASYVSGARSPAAAAGLTLSPALLPAALLLLLLLCLAGL
jgi:hypothetical protein